MTRAPQDTRFTRRNGRRLAAGTVSAAAIGVTALLLVLVPAAGARTVVGFAAPYTGFTATSSSTYSSYGCGVGHVAGTPGWSNATGTFSVLARATLTSCSGTNFGSADVASSVFSPSFHFPRSGEAYATITLTAAWSARAELNGTTASGNFTGSYAESYVSVSGYLTDLTTGGIVDAGGTTPAAVIAYETASSAGHSASSSTSTTFTISTYGPVNGAHFYEFELYFYADVYVFSDTGAGGSAVLNAGGTNGITLSSVTVS